MAYIIPKIEAILEIKSDADCSIFDDVVTWYDGNPTNITEEQITAKRSELQAEYDAKEYARTRKRQYPHLREFAEAYCEKEIGGDSTKWDAYIIKYNKVRSDNSK